jgi:sulfite exporter TauE/SafE
VCVLLSAREEQGKFSSNFFKQIISKIASIFSYSLVGGKLGAVVSFVLEAEDFQQIGDYSASSMGQVFNNFNWKYLKEVMYLV